MKQEWQPIETAPKDGQRILIGWWEDPDHESWQARAAYWEDAFECAWSEEIEDNLPVAAWTDDAVASFAYEETHSYQPTHWMPLPEPPAL